MAGDMALLKTRELADYLNKPVNTVRGWRHRRVGPPGFRLGRDVVYPKQGVDAWLRQQQASDLTAIGSSS